MTLPTINDLLYAYYTAALPAPIGSGSGIVSPDSQQAGKYASVSNVNTTTAPVQFAVLANIAAPSAGYYKVIVTYGFGATAEATTSDNFQLVVNTTGITNLPATVGQANTLFPNQEFNLNLNSGDIVKIITNTAASASSVYKTMVKLTRIS